MQALIRLILLASLMMIVCVTAPIALSAGTHGAPGIGSVAAPVPLSAGTHGAPGAVNAGEAAGLIIDTDMGLDDVRALFALLADTSLDIHGIVTVEGSASAGKGTDNLIGLLESVHMNDIPICRGQEASHLKAPPWRETANSLGGNPFPPPVETSASPCTPERLNGMLMPRNGELHYLALGPLGNLARLENGRPGSLARIGTIWMPARINMETGITGWNLLYDAKSTAVVLREAPDVILIDVSGARDIDALEMLSDLSGSSSASRWIKHSVSSGGGAHLFLHDELAAAALIQPEHVQIHEKTYELDKIDGGKIEINPAPGGNIRIAALESTGEALKLLKGLWETPSRPDFEHGHSHGGGIDPSIHAGDGTDPHIPTVRLLKTFHGHLGPYVVLGYRMGRLALEITGSEGHFGISAEVHSILKPPASCLIDGVQLGSGCTLGKRNIEVHGIEGPAYAIFETDHGEKVTIRLRPDIPGLITRLIEEKGVEAAGENILEISTESLFDVEVTRLHTHDR